MAAYAIGALRVRDTGWLNEYGEAMPALIRKHSGKVLAKSPAQTLEGDDRLPGTVVMIEFPTAAAARSWYDDPAHARLKQLRRAGSDFDLLLVDGL